MMVDRRKLLTFRADLDSGEGEVKSWPRFEELDALTRADLLKDWKYDLEQLYEEALIEFDRDLLGSRAKYNRRN
jgi:hypothetical protein